MKTLFLEPSTWDLALDSAGNIAVAEAPYQRAQDAASAIRTFIGEVYYDTAQGVPHFEQILGHWPPIELVRAYLAKAAMTAAGVVAAKVYLTAMIPAVQGQVQVVDASGAIAAVGF